MANILGQMVENTLVSGKLIKWKAKVLLHGQMVEYMLVTIKMIRSMELVYLNGLMAGSMTENGKTENNTEMVNILEQPNNKGKVSGRTEEELNGNLMMKKVVL